MTRRGRDKDFGEKSSALTRGKRWLGMLEARVNRRSRSRGEGERGIVGDRERKRGPV